MKFSIIIPAHNAENRLWMALESVKRQSFKDYELIVVCDACTDGTEQVARRYTDKVYPVDFHNEGMARNTGLDHASGEWVLWIDDDDYWLHEFVLEQIADQLTDDVELLCFSFIFKGVGYASPTGNNGAHWIAVWNKCYRREFFEDLRFGMEIPCDVAYTAKVFQKMPKLQDWDMPIYYYEYMRPGSTTWKIHKGEL